jgi:sec-independent protein translocase protein TatC
MTAVAPPPTEPPKKKDFDPDDFRMTVGEHLEDLRRRMIFALLGLGIVLLVCLFYGDDILKMFIKPLYDALEARHLNAQIHYDQLGEGFSVWVQVNVIVAAAIASPWIVYQLWLFVAAGLYPAERKYVTKYAPLSIVLLISGILFVYLLVLPWTIGFFIDFADSVPIPEPQVTTTQPYTPVIFPQLDGDPPSPKDGEVWFNKKTSRLKMYRQGAVTNSIRFTAEKLLAPDITLSEYIDLVIGMLITFALSFQLPLVVLALARIGILDVEQLKGFRKVVYLVMAVLAAAITPGDVITATMALMVPLCLLYELGIWLASRSPKKSATA